MPKLKTLQLESQYIAGLDRISLDVTVYVNGKGEFYCALPEMLYPCFDLSCAGWQGSDFFQNRQGITCIKKESYGELVSCLQHALDEIARPNEIREKVIGYYIESQGTFAIDSAGGIHRDLTGNVDGKWFDKTSDRSGSYMATPYSLSISVGVFWRITRTLAGKTVVTYERVRNEDKNSLEAILNGWQCFPRECQQKIIPYSDKAARFFISLIEGMCRLNYLVQTATFDEKDLLETINKGTLLLPNR